MGRLKEFDIGMAVDAAIGVFREHGFEGTSTDMLLKAMQIGRQSLYDTFGDKWQLYCEAVRRYSAREASAHVAALRSQPRAMDGIRAMIGRVADGAHENCLGVGSICEFGNSHADLVDIHAAAHAVISTAIADHIRSAQKEGDAARDLDPEEAAAFMTANFAGIRIAARGGAGPDQVRALAALALRALR
ncbi:MAG: TetR family transcriptional regulator [Thalassospira sp.]|uniref:TetR/AcrR family transcriptional regulator n=1 Tax=Thalassospira sp. TaxID=1912094 RepID=UPI000C5032E2|nr:TetR/AcrR family transcriptional regulator [Thalassospira sp.]MAZ32662.1 TetR family transcriptional regulator [Thalassospira sp.]